MNKHKLKSRKWNKAKRIYHCVVWLLLGHYTPSPLLFATYYWNYVKTIIITCALICLAEIACRSLIFSTLLMSLYLYNLIFHLFSLLPHFWFIISFNVATRSDIFYISSTVIKYHWISQFEDKFRQLVFHLQKLTLFSSAVAQFSFHVHCAYASNVV